MIASKAETLFSVKSFCLPVHKPLGKFHGIISRLVYHLDHVTLVSFLIHAWYWDFFFFSSLLDAKGLININNSQRHRHRICLLWPCSITMKQSESCGRVVNRYKCQFLSSHLSTSGIFFFFLIDILASLWCTLLSLALFVHWDCLFNNAFYVHILFTFFHGVSWQRIKYIYFKGVWELLLHLYLQ